MLRRWIILGAVCLCAGLFSGCAIVDQRSQLLPEAELAGREPYYVASLDGDKRHLETVIRDELRALGHRAEAGPLKAMPAETQVLVTYEDRWFWDMANYLLQLNIEFRDPKTNYPLAVGESIRTSIARKSPPEMANEVLTGMFQAPKP